MNDPGGTLDRSGGTPTAAQAAVDEIQALGGEAAANRASVADAAAVQKMVDKAVPASAGVDTSSPTTPVSCPTKVLSKMTLDHFRFVVGALDGTFICGKAVSELLQPESVPPGVLTQQAEGAPTRVFFALALSCLCGPTSR